MAVMAGRRGRPAWPLAGGMGRAPGIAPAAAHPWWPAWTLALALSAVVLPAPAAMATSDAAGDEAAAAVIQSGPDHDQTDVGPDSGATPASGSELSGNESSGNGAAPEPDSDPVAPEPGISLMQALDEAAWIGDGPPSDRHVYVLFATDCRWSRALFEQTRAGHDGLQLRWLVMAGPGAEQVVGQASVTALADAFAGRSTGVPLPAAAAPALASNAWLQPMLGAGHRFPVLVYQAGDGVRVQSGFSAGQPALPDEVIARPGRGRHSPAIWRLLAAPLPPWQPAPAGPYIRFHAEPAPVHALPSRDSLVVGQLPHLGTYPAVLGLVGDDWIEVAGLRVADRGGRTLSAYIHAPEAVALMRLAYDLLPADGKVVAGTAARPIHSHPSRQAPVLHWLQPGYQMDRAGEVLIDGQAWDAVVFFTDGGHGFVPR